LQKAFKRLNKRNSKIEKIVLSFWLLLGSITSIKIGSYVDAPTDVALSKLNFEMLLKIGNLDVSLIESSKPFVAVYGHSVALIIFGPIWILGKFFDSNFTLSDPIAMMFRNLLTFVIGFLGFVAFTKWVKMVLDPRMHKFALLLPIVIPTWFGNTFFNSKDIPVATGFLALLYVFAFYLDNNKSERHSLLFNPWIFVAIVCTVGTRPVTLFWVIPGFLVLFFAIRKKEMYLRAEVGFSFSIALLYVILTNYYLLTDPLFWIANLINVGREFPWTGAVLSWGNLYRSPEIPRTYLFEMLFAQIPLGVFIILLFCFTIFFSKNRQFITKTPKSILLAISILSIVSMQTLLLAPVLYDNARHLIFLWCYFAAFVYWLISLNYNRVNKNRIIRWSLLLSLLFSAIDQVSLYPYNYIYRNEVARQLPVGSFETDYWGLSGREMAEWVIRDSELDANPKAKFSYIFQQSYQPYVTNSHLNLVSINDRTAKYYSQIWRPGLLPDYSAQCPIAYSVERSFLLGKKEVLGYVRKCE